MSETVAGLRQNKEKLSVTVSKKVKDDYEKLGNALEYGGLSNVVETALNFYLGALYKENDIKVKQLESELAQLRNEYEGKIKQLEAEQKTYREVMFTLLIKHPELSTEISEIQKEEKSKSATYKMPFYIE